MEITPSYVITVVLSILTAVLASSGLWAFITKKAEKKDVKTQMLIGLAHDRIIYLAYHYIERGYITKDEYENLHDYLYYPYQQMGGNGSAKRAMVEVDKLPVRSSNYSKEDASKAEDFVK